jgi:hypothetical protein
VPHLQIYPLGDGNVRLRLGVHEAVDREGAKGCIYREFFNQLAEIRERAADAVLGRKRRGFDQPCAVEESVVGGETARIGGNGALEDGIQGLVQGVAGPLRRIADIAVNVLVIGRHKPVLDGLEETRRFR